MKIPDFQAARALFAAAALLCPFLPHSAWADAGTNPKEPSRVTVTVQADAPGKKISPDLIGIFFEDINYAADGGLYAELVQNRSFEYSQADHWGWNALTSWQFVERGGKGTLKVETAGPFHPNNPHYAVLTAEGAGAGLMNSGFDGIPVKVGEAYNFSLLAKQTDGMPMALTVTLESKTGAVLGKTTLPPLGKTWAKYPAKISATGAADDARLVVTAAGRGTVCLDTVSLFPEKTFHNRPNGMRADLGLAIANLKPKFMRFPGGCLAHGDGLGNMYRWKDTIGPIEQRKEQRNIWNYHQSVGLGYHEYFQFCEDIGAKPLPVLAAGVCCQNSNHKPGGPWGQGQEGLPMDQMGAWTQDVLDLVEYANGPVTAPWGAKRAANGHPAPFNLEYLGVGNEDNITPAFKERFQMIYQAVKAKYPKLTVIGTVGPSPNGPDYDNGWKIANELKVDMVDEHYYETPKWFLNNLSRYDTYDRAASKVYLGEYASKGNTLANALSEAAYLTALERNGDVVHLASYAPLLGKEQHTQWNPNLIYFTNTAVNPTVNYYVQQMYGTNQGDTYLPTALSFVSTQPAKPSNRTTLLLGAWDTQAEFKDVTLAAGANAPVKAGFDAASTGWTPASGQWKVTGGSYAQSATVEPALTRYAFAGDKGKCTLTLKARKTGGAEGFLVGFGATDSEDYYWWNLGGWANREHGVERVSNGAKETVGRRVPGIIETNRWYDIKIEVDGKRVRCYLDGALVHDIADISQGEEAAFAASCVKDTSTGDLVVKLVNPGSAAVQSQVVLTSAGAVVPEASKTVLTGDPKALNLYGSPQDVLPTKANFTASKSFTYEAPPYSFTVLRMKTR